MQALHVSIAFVSALCKKTDKEIKMGICKKGACDRKQGESEDLPNNEIESDLPTRKPPVLTVPAILHIHTPFNKH